MRPLEVADASADATDAESPPPVMSEEPGLAACYGAAAQGVGLVGDRAGRPTLRLLVNHEPRPRAVDEDAPAAEVRGVNVHAKQTVGTQRPPHTECGASYDGERGPGPRPAEGRLGGPCGRRRRWGGRDRRALERLARYITRPPLSKERLERRVDGRFELELKSVWRDGTRALVFDPLELITRLVAAVPPPRMHLLRYFGVLSSHSKLRRETVPEPPEDPTRTEPAPAAGDQLALELDDADPLEPAPRRRRDPAPAPHRVWGVVCWGARPRAPTCRRQVGRAVRRRWRWWAWLLRHVFTAPAALPRALGP